jgi:Cu/Ag efflux protein CusF
MRNLALLLGAVLVAALLMAQTTPLAAAGKTHSLTATVVSVDLEKKTVTIKDENGEEKTAPVLDKAIKSLKSVHAGDKVTLTCLDNDKGEHQGVSAIKVEKS